MLHNTLPFADSQLQRGPHNWSFPAVSTIRTRCTEFFRSKQRPERQKLNSQIQSGTNRSKFLSSCTDQKTQCGFPKSHLKLYTTYILHFEHSTRNAKFARLIVELQNLYPTSQSLSTPRAAAQTRRTIRPRKVRCIFPRSDTKWCRTQ